MAYEVKSSVFEGPFDLLLHLVTRNQVDLYQVSLSQIVDTFLAELEGRGHADLEVTSEFVLIAATLVELKSRRLLPSPPDPELDEELARWEERDLLLARLLQCRTFANAASELRRMKAIAERSLPRPGGLEEPFRSVAPDLLAGVSPEDLRGACLRAITPRPVPRVDLDHVAPIRVSVGEAVGVLVEELPRLGATTFRRLTGHLVEPLEVIVRFLALLELYKQGRVDLDQGEAWGELRIRWLGNEGARQPVLDAAGG